MSNYTKYFAHNPESLLMLTDSYKDGHHFMLMRGTKNVYSYYESRMGAVFPYTVFVGLQFYLKMYLEGMVVTHEMIDAAEEFSNDHFMGYGKFNRKMWERIVDTHGGKLPIRIKAVPEGTPVPISNILMSVEVTDEELFEHGEVLLAPLTNILETILTHVWAASNVATISRDIRESFENTFDLSVDEEDYWMLDFMLHDFGFRGVSSVQSAGMSGAGHLTIFQGTDTKVAISYMMAYYGADKMVGFSVNATEHSVTTQLGPEGEFEVLREILTRFPSGPLSYVGDGFDIENFVKTIGQGDIKDSILNRDGKFIVRPDSPRFKEDTPLDQILWILDQLGEDFGFTINSKGYKVLNSKVGVIYGDGLSRQDIKSCIEGIVSAGWAASSCVFGMGGGLLQKHNRDTQRMAFKCSARKDYDTWVDVYKEPKDKTKASKRGRMKLIKDSRVSYKTVPESHDGEDCLVTVFENGEIVKSWTVDEIRENSKIIK